MTAKTTTRNEKLRFWSIIGVVDHHGAVHSAMFEDYSAHTHGELWPQHRHARWRWTFSNGLHFIARESKPDAEGIDAIRSHLTKKFGIEWQENGYHDWQKISADYAAEKADAEDQ